MLSPSTPLFEQTTQTDPELFCLLGLLLLDQSLVIFPQRLHGDIMQSVNLLRVFWGAPAVPGKLRLDTDLIVDRLVHFLSQASNSCAGGGDSWVLSLTRKSANCFSSGVRLQLSKV